MAQKVVIVHGWEGSPDELMIKNIGSDLESKGFEVIIPEMPDTNHPRINLWVSKLSKVVSVLDKDTFFIGHSIGCQTILRFLEKTGCKIGGVVFIAPWLKLSSKALEDDDARKIATPWLRIPINFSSVKPLTDNIICLFSDNDPFVPLINESLFQKNLGAKTIIEHDKGHYTTSDGVVDNKTVVKELLRFASQT